MDRIGVQVERSRRTARFYRERGWNPLPTRRTRKAPTLRYGHLWEAPAPSSIYGPGWDGYNVQVMTGSAWGLAVVDLDGPEALAAWPTLGSHAPTWEASRGPGSRHVWFRLPDWLPSLRSRGRIWGVVAGRDARGAPRRAPRTTIELLADRRLVMAPPSIHPTTGTRYAWLPGRGPADLDGPATIPEWILDLPDLDTPSKAPPGSRPNRSDAPRRPAGASYPWRDVLAAVTDPAALAASWGLRLTGRSAGPDALECHAVGRPDAHPSALLNVVRARYWDPWVAGGRSIGLFELAILLGAYPTFADAVDGIGAALGARPIASGSRADPDESRGLGGR